MFGPHKYSMVSLGPHFLSAGGTINVFISAKKSTLMSNALPTNHLKLVPFQSHVSSHSNQFLDQLPYSLSLLKISISYTYIKHSTRT